MRLKKAVACASAITVVAGVATAGATPRPTVTLSAMAIESWTSGESPADLLRWVNQPTASDINYFYPPDLRAASYVTLNCALRSPGLLRQCKVRSLEPNKPELRTAAMGLVQYFKADWDEGFDAVRGDRTVTLYLRFSGDPDDCPPPWCVATIRPPPPPSGPVPPP